jgi:hypothetical protein
MLALKDQEGRETKDSLVLGIRMIRRKTIEIILAKKKSATIIAIQSQHLLLLLEVVKTKTVQLSSQSKRFLMLLRKDLRQ